MAEQYKSVLEKYNASLKPRLPTAEEEAIEPVYPEEYLMGGPDKVAASGLRSSAEKAAAKAASRERIANVRIGSKARDLKADKAAKEEFAKTKWGKATYEDLGKQSEQAAKQKSVGQVSDAAERAALKSSGNLYGNVGWDAGADMAEARRNAAGDTYKKGGRVKATASSRADGIASRGKTKGRLV